MNFGFKIVQNITNALEKYIVWGARAILRRYVALSLFEASTHIICYKDETLTDCDWHILLATLLIWTVPKNAKLYWIESCSTTLAQKWYCVEREWTVHKNMQKCK